MPTGKLKRYVSDKGFGFIGADQGGEDIFAHSQQFTGDAESLRGGERVTYEAEYDDKRGKYKATTWSLDANSAPTPMQTGKIKKNFADKGFCFIAADAGGDDMFAHHKQFKGTADPGNLEDGTEVRYEVEFDSKKGKNKAGTWQLASDPVGGAPGGMPGFGQPQGMGGSMGGPMGYPPAGGMPGCGGPMPGYGGMPGHGGPQPGYGAPMPMTGPCGGYGPMGGAPNHGAGPYGAPQPGYGQPGPYGSPAPGGYGAPAPAGGPPPGGGAPSLPPGWEQLTDPASGKPYWCNRSTGESSWTPPAGAPAGAPAPAPAPAPAAAPCGLPAGWESAPDPASGKTYYFNRATNETRWEPPVA
eukprot:TRINITY_DN3948_c1_g1_i4.p1 TRINITY_DN3948_c1_g1~~TRINITY_DN3948_c1_g1_i4.p1  ORF type:complete len:356 (-),score=66.25 TRINITY_DN3948_c1_g1_i4:555-1622(-)